jgi:hypothetical protein
MTRNKLYGIISIACFVGTVYFFYQLFYATESTRSLCLIKNVTGYPCPSCGTTRATILLSKGALLESLYQNPFGIIVALCMLVLPLWIAFDVLKKTDTFYRFYLKTETIIRRPKVAIVLILLVILNWIWNLYKHL